VTLACGGPPGAGTWEYGYDPYADYGYAYGEYGYGEEYGYGGEYDYASEYGYPEPGEYGAEEDVEAGLGEAAGADAAEYGYPDWAYSTGGGDCGCSPRES
jgi:hypothetical protein